MEAVTRPIEGEKAQRIVEAMRTSVARHGAAGATFDVVSREAGVSRGLLHYYFGTKERLLGEAVRRDCDMRMERLEAQLATAASAEDFIDLLRVALTEFVADDGGEFATVIFELFTIARRNPEVAEEFAELLRRTREQVAAMLRAKAEEGVLQLHGDPEAIADLLFSLGDGLALRMLSEPGRDWGTTVEAGVLAVRALIV
ncbi:MAG TPA: TetR/AcrR family transcriptional regulator [Solirubrobacteraceae bacterium]